jgi:hypothetical protein
MPAHRYTRRGALAGAAALAATARAAPAPGFRASLSVSPFSEAVLKATSLTDGTVTARTLEQLQNLYVRHGATEVYARIATRKVAPQGPVAEHGWARGIERARFARRMGLPFNPELGLWAEYGDVANYQQPPDFRDYPQIRLPGPWLTLTIDQMLPPLRQYGALVARQILATGARVNVWDIGNEVECGIAGVAVRPLVPAPDYAPPDAVDPEIGRKSVGEVLAMPEAERIAWCRTHLWPHVGRLIGAVAEGVRSVDRRARFSTHISGAAQKTAGVHLAFWEALKAAGYLPDEFGASYYPTSGGTGTQSVDAFQWFKATATELKTRFGRPVFIAEGGYPSGHMGPPFPWNTPVPGYPIDAAGQAAFNRDLIAWGSKSGALSGYRPWAPDLCVGPGWEPMAWFDAKGRAKPVLGAFREGLRG